MKESLTPQTSASQGKKEIMTREHVYQVKNEGDREEEDKSCGSITKTSVMYILEGLRTVVTPREGWRRALVLLGVFQYICYISVYLGTEGSHRLYFVENKYKWSEEELSTYLFDIRIAQVSNNRFCTPALYCSPPPSGWGSGSSSRCSLTQSSSLRVVWPS